MLSSRPATDEYGSFCAGYVARVPDGQWMARLEAQPAELRAALTGVDSRRAAQPTAPGKWSLLDLLSHLSDTERVLAFRLLWFARSDASDLPGFDQDAWVTALAGQPRTLDDQLDGFATVRAGTLALLRTVPDAAADRRGVANGSPITVRALAWVIPGHAQHHLDALRGMAF